MFFEVKCELGESYRVAEVLVEIESASEVYSISGSYDLLIKCYLAAEEDIGHFVNERIHKSTRYYSYHDYDRIQRI